MFWVTLITCSIIWVNAHFAQDWKVVSQELITIRYLKQGWVETWLKARRAEALPNPWKRWILASPGRPQARLARRGGCSLLPPPGQRRRCGAGPLGGDLSPENMALGKPESETHPEGYLLAYKHGSSFGSNFCAFYLSFLGKWDVCDSASPCLWLLRIEHDNCNQVWRQDKGFMVILFLLWWIYFKIWSELQSERLILPMLLGLQNWITSLKKTGRDIWDCSAWRRESCAENS